MNVANLELCKELYELSGWDVGVQYAYSFSPSKLPSGEVINRWYVRKNKRITGVKRIPAYDLGYLLRKLPGNTSLTKGVQGKYRARIAHLGVGGFTHDTPEDAACKLAIALFKQGILK